MTAEVTVGVQLIAHAVELVEVDLGVEEFVQQAKWCYRQAKVAVKARQTWDSVNSKEGLLQKTSIWVTLRVDRLYLVTTRTYLNWQKSQIRSSCPTWIQRREKQVNRSVDITWRRVEQHPNRRKETQLRKKVSVMKVPMTILKEYQSTLRTPSTVKFEGIPVSTSFHQWYLPDTTLCIQRVPVRFLYLATLIR